MKNCLNCSIQLKDYRSLRCNKCRAKALPVVFTDEVRIKMSLARKGKKFNSHSEKTKWKMRESAIKNGNKPIHNKPHSEVTKEKISKARTGYKAWNYLEDRSLLKKDGDRGSPAHREWSLSVKKRDLWKCRIADINCNGRLESHHILSWKDNQELRYEINNGITLCHAHHPKKRAEEKRLVPTFQELVSVSKI